MTTQNTKAKKLTMEEEFLPKSAFDVLYSIFIFIILSAILPELNLLWAFLVNFLAFLISSFYFPSPFKNVNDKNAPRETNTMNSKKLFLPFLLLIFIINVSIAQDELLINTPGRYSLSINGNDWHYIVDPYENGYYNYRYEAFDKMTRPGKGAFFLNSKPEDKSDLVEYDFSKSEQINVPGDWNTQKEKLFYYEGTIWYEKSFDYQKKSAGNRVFLYFGAINYHADIYLNGQKLGTHTGGFTPFNFEITDKVIPIENFLIIKVDNKRKKEGVPTLNKDWWNYGGITRDVKILETPANYIQDYLIQLDPENNKIIKGYVRLTGNEVNDKQIQLNIEQLHIAKKILADIDGLAEFSIPVEGVKYWSPVNPKLYQVRLKSGNDTITDHIGFRTIKVHGKNILLNGQKIFLRGISIHEERPFGGGRVRSVKDAEQLLSWAKELGCNYVRLAHYPHNEHMVRLADKMGILVWEEIPVYWTIDWSNKATFANAKNQLHDVIYRDKNRAAVIIWSMANETPVSQERNEFLVNLATLTRKADPTRLISAALEQSSDPQDHSIRVVSDPFADVVDVLSINEYIGWYDGLPEKCRKVSWKIDPSKPLLISEFGGGAKYGFHGDPLTRWSEEYQEYLYKETLQMIDKIPQLAGLTPWILMDFRSPRRVLPEIQDNWNRKGLISEKGEKKKAFFVLQDYYRIKAQAGK